MPESRGDQESCRPILSRRRVRPGRPWATAAAAALGLALLAAAAVWPMHPRGSGGPNPAAATHSLVVSRAGPPVVASARIRPPLGLDGADMVNARQGYAWAGQWPAMALWSTTDGGRTWTRVYDTSQGIVQAEFVTPTDGYLLVGGCAPFSGSCGSSTLWATRDGGHAWTPTHAFATPVASVTVAGPGDMWAVLATPENPSPRLLQTLNGGRTWAARPGPAGALGVAAEDLAWLNATQGWLLTGGEASAGSQDKMLYETRNGGRSWSLVASAAFGGIAAGSAGVLPQIGYVPSSGGLAFISPGVGFLALDRAGLFETVNGGASWQPAPQPLPGADLARIGFWSATGGYMQEGTAPGPALPLYLTVDGGRHWRRRYPPVLPDVASPIPGSPRWLGFGDLLGQAALDIQTSADAGHTWTPVALAPSGTQFVQALSTRDWVAVGDQIAVTRDGGRHWRILSLPGLPYLSTVSFGNRRDGWVYIGGRGLYTTRDGGRSWVRAVTAGALPFHPEEMVQVSAETGYALGTAREARSPRPRVPVKDAVVPPLPSELWVSHNAGRSWRASRLPSPYIFHMTFYRDSAMLWTGRRYWVSEDGAARWTVRPWPAGWLIQSVNAMGHQTFLATVGSATTSSATQFLTTNGGASWTAIP